MWLRGLWCCCCFFFPCWFEKFPTFFLCLIFPMLPPCWPFGLWMYLCADWKSYKLVIKSGSSLIVTHSDRQNTIPFMKSKSTLVSKSMSHPWSMILSHPKRTLGMAAEEGNSQNPWVNDPRTKIPSETVAMASGTPPKVSWQPNWNYLDISKLEGEVFPESRGMRVTLWQFVLKIWIYQFGTIKKTLLIVFQVSIWWWNGTGVARPGSTCWSF